MRHQSFPHTWRGFFKKSGGRERHRPLLRARKARWIYEGSGFGGGERVERRGPQDHGFLGSRMPACNGSQWLRPVPRPLLLGVPLPALSFPISAWCQLFAFSQLTTVDGGRGIGRPSIGSLTVVMGQEVGVEALSSRPRTSSDEHGWSLWMIDRWLPFSSCLCQGEARRRMRLGVGPASVPLSVRAVAGSPG